MRPSAFLPLESLNPALNLALDYVPMPKWEKARKYDDVCMPREEARRSDIVIPIMGVTGSGKSTFVNNVLGRRAAEVSDGFRSCTQAIQHYVVDIPGNSPHKQAFLGRRLVLVDTPGFDDETLTDHEILRRIAIWLASSYSHKMKVGGVVYTYPIYPGRFTRRDGNNLQVFQKICGQKAITKVALATTRWDICPSEVGAEREDYLRTHYWKEMLGGPESDANSMALMARLDDSAESAWNLVNQILGRLLHAGVDGGILALQAQLVDMDKELRETDAAQGLLRKLEQLLEESGRTDPKHRTAQATVIASQIKQLRLPIGARIMRFFKLVSLASI